MNKEKLAIKLFGRFFAFIFSILLIVSIVVAAIFSSLQSLLTVKSVTKIMKNIPYEEIIDTVDFEKAISDLAEKSGEEFDVSQESIGNTIEDIVDSKTVKEILELYSEDVADIMSGRFDESKATPEKVKEIFSDNSDEIVEIITENYPELDKNEVENTIETIIDENLGELVEALPEPEELKYEFEDMEMDMVLGLLAGRTALYIVWGVVFVLALIVFVCRLYRFKGLKWIGIDAIIATGSIVSFSVLMETELFADVVDNAFISSIVSLITQKMYTIGTIVGIGGVCFIVAGIVLHFMYKRKENY